MGALFSERLNAARWPAPRSPIAWTRSSTTGLAPHGVRGREAPSESLRRKPEDDPARPKLVVTEPGVGYRLRAGD